MEIRVKSDHVTVHSVLVRQNCLCYADNINKWVIIFWSRESCIKLSSVLILSDFSHSNRYQKIYKCWYIIFTLLSVYCSFTFMYDYLITCFTL